MSKLLRVLLEHDDKTMILEGAEAEKWDKHVTNLSVMAQNRSGNQNPFDHDPVNWTIIPKINKTTTSQQYE